MDRFAPGTKQVGSLVNVLSVMLTFLVLNSVLAVVFVAVLLLDMMFHAIMCLGFTCMGAAQHVQTCYEVSLADAGLSQVGV